MTEMVLGFYFERFQDEWLVWLIRKNRPTWQRGKLNGIGGHVEPDESPLRAMRREFREEAGLDIDNWVHAITLNGPGWRVHIFRVFHWGYGPAHPSTQTDETVSFYQTGAMFPRTLAIPNLEWIVPLLLDKEISPPVHMYASTHSGLGVLVQEGVD